MKLMKKQKTWNCKECYRVNNIKFDKCYSCGKPRSEVEMLPFLDCFTGDAVEDRIIEIESKIIDEKETKIEIKIKRIKTNQSISYQMDATEDEIRYINIMLSVWPNTLLNMVEDFVVSQEEKEV